MKFTIAILLVIALQTGGCATSRKSAQRTCAEQQAMIWDAAASRFLSEPVRSGQLIDPVNLGGFFRGGKTPKCPSGSENYRPFSILEGPHCPNEPVAHTVKAVPDRVEIIREAFQKKAKP
ncbi:MAG TPA: hypothetical protein VK968_10255 [Roseimicrobium sp.]|nr:hypothetical protein [Roseimicrobium sp.]